jgi:succinyl-diaminopimelate desuccinylase
VTPVDAGAQDVLAAALEGLGFAVTRLQFGGTPNLFARIGTQAPHFCFAGHTDVVPAGDGNWRAGAFSGEVRDGMLYGRGACDMKGAIASFVAAAAGHLEAGAPRGSISLLITGDEEGPAVDGTVKVLEWMAANGHVPDFCLVGEPTNPTVLGEVIKVGRRGSVNMTLSVEGVQGHVAYPHRVDNPVHRLVRILEALTAAPIDAGSEFFEPTSIQVTSVDVGNPATNVVPARARAMLNIRFNDHHRGAWLADWVRATASRYAERFTLDVSISGESFLTAPGPAVDALAGAVAAATGVQPKLDTGGGTSDARFIAPYCAVAEFGLVGSTMHQVDECVPVAELRALAATYRAVLAAFLP